MPLLISFLKTTVAAGLVFAGGWWAGWLWAPGSAGTTASQGAEIKKLMAEEVATPAESSIAEKAKRDRADFVKHLRGGTKRVDHGQLDEWARTVVVTVLEDVVAELGASPEPTPEIQLLVSRLAARDAEAAVRCFEAWTSFGRFQLLRAVAAGWASHDPRAALAWLSLQTPNGATDGAREEALSRLAAMDPHEALKTFRERGWTWDSPDTMRGLFRVWAREDPQAAMHHWRQLNEELNPRTTPQATPPLPPFTATLVGEILEPVDAKRQPEQVSKILDALEPEELARLGARFWFRWLLKRDLATYLPMLEERMGVDEMKEVVQLSGALMPDKAQEMRAALKNPELRQSVPLPPAPGVSPTMPGDSGAGRAPARISVEEREAFWSEPLKLDP